MEKERFLLDSTLCNAGVWYLGNQGRFYMTCIPTDWAAFDAIGSSGQDCVLTLIS